MGQRNRKYQEVLQSFRGYYTYLGFVSRRGGEKTLLGAGDLVDAHDGTVTMTLQDDRTDPVGTGLNVVVDFPVESIFEIRFISDDNLPGTVCIHIDIH